jgi:enterochelin esterase family protein
MRTGSIERAGQEQYMRELRVTARVAASALLLASFCARAQAPPPSPNDTLVSPEVKQDRRVTFRIFAPMATDVTVRGDWMQGPDPVKLQKDDQGVWSVTVGPLAPDFYSYLYMVDGVRTVDPKNAAIKQGINRLDNTFEVPGEDSAFEANLLVPHGEIRQVWFSAPTLDASRRMHVYTPPGYETGTTRYPVLYLLHGGGDEDSGWSTIGRAGFILDNLIAAKKAKPMIVVMPNGSLPRPADLGPATPAGGPPSPAAAAAMQERFANHLVKDIMHFVEKHYRVLATRENRALAGLSMGGGQTLRTTVSNPDKFAYVGVWSAGVNDQRLPDFEKQSASFLSSADTVNKDIKVFWIGVGSEDQLAAKGARNLKELLEKNRIKHEFHESGGGHTWINWRHYLNQYAQLLFR